MKIKKLFRNKKAFSAVIASLILMLLAVAAGVVVYAYVMGWIGNAQQGTTNTGILQIDSVTATASSDTVTLYVRNVGSTDLTLSSFYITGTVVTNTTTPITASLPVQGTACLQSSAISLDANKLYDVKVVCADGTMVSGSVEAE